MDSITGTPHTSVAGGWRMRRWLILITSLFFSQPAQGGLVLVDTSSGTGVGGSAGERAASLQRVAGAGVQLACVSTDGRPVTWTHSGLVVTSDTSRHDVTTTYDNGLLVSTLSIRPLQLLDSGVLQCYTTAEAGSNRDYATVRLDVITQAERDRNLVRIVDPLLDSLDVALGQPLYLKCAGREGADLRWYHEGRLLQAGFPHLIIQQAQSIDDRSAISFLTRLSVREGDGGEYRCQDTANPDIHDVINVNVRRNPRNERTAITIMDSVSSQHQVTEGSRYQFKCRADAHTQLLWYLNNIQLHDGHNGFRILEAPDANPSLKTSILVRERAEKRFEGRYTCVNVADRRDHDDVTLVVLRKDESVPSSEPIPTQVSEVLMTVGASITLQCSHGAARHHIPEWTKGSQILVDGERYLIQHSEGSSMLVINNAGRADVGQYKCVFRDPETGHADGIVEFNISTAPCPSLSLPAHGQFDDRCPQYPVYGESCTVQCNDQYELVSSVGTVTCLYDSDSGRTYWSSMPTCELVPAKPDVYNVPTSVTDVRLRVGAPLNLRCRGTWSKSNVNIVSGHKYHLLDHGDLVVTNTDASDAGVYSCKVKLGEYQFAIQTFNVTTVECPDIQPPSHGSIHNCSLPPLYGETCYFLCDEGYQLAGARSRFCDIAAREGSTLQPHCLSEAEISYGEQVNSAGVLNPDCLITFLLSSSSLLLVLKTSLLTDATSAVCFVVRSLKAAFLSRMTVVVQLFCSSSMILSSMFDISMAKLNTFIDIVLLRRHLHCMESFFASRTHKLGKIWIIIDFVSPTKLLHNVLCSFLYKLQSILQFSKTVMLQAYNRLSLMMSQAGAQTVMTSSRIAKVIWFTTSMVDKLLPLLTFSHQYLLGGNITIPVLLWHNISKLKISNFTKNEAFTFYSKSVVAVFYSFLHSQIATLLALLSDDWLSDAVSQWRSISFCLVFTLSISVLFALMYSVTVVYIQ